MTMSLSNLMGLLQQYENPAAANTAAANTAPANAANVEQDFEQVSQNASQSHVATGLAEAFRSSQTPPFAQMLTSLFRNSDGQQQAGILNRLLSSVGSAAGSSMLGGIGRGAEVTPEQAQQIQPESVQQLAQQAEKSDPSIIEKASSFYAQHPTLVKTLGAGSLALIMSHMSRTL